MKSQIISDSLEPWEFKNLELMNQNLDPSLRQLPSCCIFTIGEESCDLFIDEY